MTRIVVVGAAGQGRETKWLVQDLQDAGRDVSFVGYVVSDASRSSPYDSRDEIIGDLGWLERNRDGWDGLALGIGFPAARLKVAAELEARFGPDVWPPLVHPSVVADRRTCRIGHGALIAAGTVMTVNVAIGPQTMVNTNCTLGHEATVGRGCVVNPGANVGGGVVLDDGVLVGTGAQILQYRRVGAGATVGAGAVVTRDVAAGATVVGVPARTMEKKR